MAGDKSGLSATEKRYHRLGLIKPQDFMLHLPLRYEDETTLHTIQQATPGQKAQFQGQISNVEVAWRGRRQVSARLTDATGSVNLRWFHFYPSLITRLKAGKPLRVRGEVRRGYRGLEIVHPAISAADKALPKALTPIYPSTQGLSQTHLRQRIREALDHVDKTDTLPAAVLAESGLMSFSQAIKTLHFPDPQENTECLMDKTHPAWQRIKLDELLAQQLSLAAARAARRKLKAYAMTAQDNASDSLLARFYQQLPFTLTAAQQRVIDEITSDLQRSYPMHRLLQGDVGSGKTVVAAVAALHAIASGFQVAMMAPTELLAEQHYEKLCGWLEPLGVKVAWLTGSLGAADRRQALEDLASGHAQMVIGTQALIQEKVNFVKLGLVILDEQHRFGVGQRLALNRKGDKDTDTLVHQLSMSATPIPRTLAMSFLADLEVSEIDELPPGRTAVVTKLVNENRRDELIAHLQSELAQGKQAYWVCPLIEESEALQLQTAMDTHTTLAEIFGDQHVGLLHGRMTAAEKQAVMQAFREHQLALLVATTVIEVGVDVPNASLMVIEHAERFGLAQLHQLRGRVGRGATASVCVLLYQTPLTAVARERLRAMYESTDGFTIARRDLEIRGPGEFLGTRQAGQALLRFADLQHDGTLLRRARKLAQYLQKHYPEAAQAHVKRWMSQRQDYLRS